MGKNQLVLFDYHIGSVQLMWQCLGIKKNKIHISSCGNFLVIINKKHLKIIGIIKMFW